MIQFDDHIFQMGWFNYQLVTLPTSNSSPLKMNGGCFPKPISSKLPGLDIFRGETVSFRGCNHWLHIDEQWKKNPGCFGDIGDEIQNPTQLY